MTPREAFRAGFMTKCAEHGMSVKQAGDFAELLSLLALGMPPLAGAGLGYMVGKGVNNSEELDPAEVQDQEKRNEYRRLTSQLQQLRPDFSLGAPSIR